MSSRGYFIGKIIDDLDALASQVKLRCSLAQVDLNRVLEDFFKDLLNIIYSANLKNLNTDRCNAPGLDLGDRTSSKKRAYQITSTAKSQKINDTLAAIIDDDISTYDEIYILIIGERQGSYKINEELAARCNFKEDNIIGIKELCGEIMGLDMATIQAVHRKLVDEQQRIRIELEPEINGKFATSVLDMIEARPIVTRSDASIFAAHEQVEGLFDNVALAKQALDSFIDHLQRLPRLTREFFGWMLEECDMWQSVGEKRWAINADLVRGKCTDFPSFNAEIRLLMSRGFICMAEKEYESNSDIFEINFPTLNGDDLMEALTYFMMAEEISAQTMFSTMNFSAFGLQERAEEVGRSKVVKGKKKGGK